jgi:hypothetical protein
MRFEILLVAAFALLAASAAKVKLNPDQVRVARRFLARLEPVLEVADPLQKAGIDTDAMVACYEGLRGKGLSMANKKDRVTITQQCIFTAVSLILIGLSIGYYYYYDFLNPCFVFFSEWWR